MRNIFSSLLILLLPLLIADAAFVVGPQKGGVPVSCGASIVSLRAAVQEEHISIAYCTGCRWMLRAAWMAQELLTAFQDEFDCSITLVPCRPPAPGGIFVRFDYKCL